MEFIEKDNAASIDDTGIRNKWRFEWLEERDSKHCKLGVWCRKINKAGHCFCVLCNRYINYGSNGKKVLFKHSMDNEHQMLMRAQELTQTLPGSKPVIAKASLSDRVADQKAVVTAFLSENTLPFSLAGELVNLSKHLAKDKLALSKLHFSRTSATYVNTHGTAKCMREELVDKLKGTFFSLNIDEGTSNAVDKIINVMIRFYDEDKKMVVTDHLGSRKENLSTARNIFKQVSDVLSENNLLYNQVVSCLLDNCNTMRGCKKGVETL